jgi:HEPN domain-containing protein
MCHQTIEKAFKGVIARNCAEDEIPPKIHNLLRLAERAGLFSELSEEQKEFFRELNPLNIEARYPEYKNRMAETLTSDKCEEIIRETGELLCWIKEQ